MGALETISHPPVATGTFSSETDRARLTPAAVEAIRRIAAFWHLTGDQTAALLGVSPSTWDRMRSGRWSGALNQDQLTRASALIGLYKGLHLLFVDDMADRWPRLRNAGPLFRNLSPIESMIDGGLPHMVEVRKHVDALRGGL